MTDISQHYQQFALSTTSVEVLTPDQPFGRGFMWRETRRVLFLRDTCTFTVTEYNVGCLSTSLPLSKPFHLIMKLRPVSYHPLTLPESLDAGDQQSSARLAQ